MAEHAVRTLAHTPGVAGVAVVTASAEVAALSTRHGAEVLQQERDDGTAQACQEAVSRLSGRADSVLMISGDIPLLSPMALADLVALGQHGSDLVAIVPDRRRTGTNALLCAPPEVIPNCFGTDSFQRHLSAARAGKVAVHVVESEDLALDIDDPTDLDELRRRMHARPWRVSPHLREVLRLTDLGLPESGLTEPESGLTEEAPAQ